MEINVEECLAKMGRVSDSSRLWLAIGILFFSLVGVITNILLLTVLIFHWKTNFRTQHFSFFVLNMIEAGTLYCATNLWVSVPCTADRCSYISSDVMMIILATPNTLGHWGYLLASLAFAIYRFGLFISKNFAHMNYCIKVLLVLPWLFTFIITFGSTALGCYKRYNRLSLGYTFNCAKCDLFLGVTYSDLNSIAGQVIPFIMIVIYAIIIITLYRKHRGGASNSRKILADLKLALQFFVICCFQFLETYLFYLIPVVGKGTEWSVLFMNTIGTLNAAVSPTVLLLFNQQIRDGLSCILTMCFTKKLVDLTVTRVAPSRGATLSTK